jgi:hypothetical protein
MAERQKPNSFRQMLEENLQKENSASSNAMFQWQFTKINEGVCGRNTEEDARHKGTFSEVSSACGTALNEHSGVAPTSFSLLN